MVPIIPAAPTFAYKGCILSVEPVCFSSRGQLQPDKTAMANFEERSINSLVKETKWDFPTSQSNSSPQAATQKKISHCCLLICIGILFFSHLTCTGHLYEGRGGDPFGSLLGWKKASHNMKVRSFFDERNKPLWTPGEGTSEHRRLLLTSRGLDLSQRGLQSYGMSLIATWKVPFMRWQMNANHAQIQATHKWKWIWTFKQGDLMDASVSNHIGPGFI